MSTGSGVAGPKLDPPSDERATPRQLHFDAPATQRGSIHCALKSTHRHWAFPQARARPGARSVLGHAPSCWLREPSALHHRPNTKLHHIGTLHDVLRKEVDLGDRGWILRAECQLRGPPQALHPQTVKRGAKHYADIYWSTPCFATVLRAHLQNCARVGSIRLVPVGEVEEHVASGAVRDHLSTSTCREVPRQAKLPDRAPRHTAIVRRLDTHQAARSANAQLPTPSVGEVNPVASWTTAWGACAQATSRDALTSVTIGQYVHVKVVLVPGD
eukprot:CAMPEP_0182948450 /NCGR_PEP_ID=MMETSP0105_2-20130417/59766_1 /TAXON_ID=81532 ORGANISM="Acanthoeca-like sp., Strain 10tr" /NCGR_SAMPLE_ID=MMETSP0105_2 /ASSEMBLY_ACC=CAM_ASM_000205 /LENGTH=271 /DNA_ID=CAMNT_0025088743 /DNA_START=391 /DNA_END=1206 /DNA_ORIENTATION=+